MNSDLITASSTPSAEAHLAAIIESSNDAIYSKDTNGIVTSWNKAAQKLYGYSAEEIIGQSVSVLIPEDRKDEESVILGRILKGDKIDHYETQRMTKGGDLVTISLAVSPIIDQDGNIVAASAISRDIGAIRAQELIRERLVAIIDSSDDAVYSKNSKGIITSWNRGAHDLYGYNAEEVIGKHVSLLLPENYIGEEQAIIESIFSGQKVDHYETTRKCKDGSLVDVSLTVSPIKDENGTVIEASIIARDITETVKRKAREELSRLKDQFMAMAAHELRTPLTSIHGFSVTMLERWEMFTDSQKKEFMQIITDQSERLSRLVNDLLILSKLENEGLKRDLVNHNVYSLTKEVLQELDHSEMICEIDPSLNVMTDQDQFKQIMVNLVSNALKYGESPVAVKAHTEKDLVQISICDHGPGIAAEFIPQLFERFSQAQEKPVDGTGLGLAIVKGLVESQGGSVWYEPNQPTGSRFIFTLKSAQH